MEPTDLQNKVSELNGQLNNMKKSITDAYDVKMKVVQDKTQELENKMKEYSDQGVDWCNKQRVRIKIEIDSRKQEIDDLTKQAKDWMNEQTKVVEDWVADRIESLTTFVEAQVKAVEDFAEEQAEKAAERKAELELKAKTK